MRNSSGAGNYILSMWAGGEKKEINRNIFYNSFTGRDIGYGVTSSGFVTPGDTETLFLQ